MIPLLMVTLFAIAQVISYLIAFATNLITNTCQRAEPCAPKPPSGPTCDSVWAQWGEWGGCNAECGGGQRGRMRNVETRSQCNGMACEGVVEQEVGFLTVGPSICSFQALNRGEGLFQLESMQHLLFRVLNFLRPATLHHVRTAFGLIGVHGAIAQ